MDKYSNMQGFLEIWEKDNLTGEEKLRLKKKNLILYSGANTLAGLVAGTTAPLNYFYVGFNNNSSFTYPTIDLAYSVPFNQLSIPDGFGFLRLPLSLSPSFQASNSNYQNNTAIFTVQIASPTAYYGNTFTSGTSNIYECALVSVPNASSSVTDTVFSRINFNQITYVNTSVLTLIWGVQFTASN